jgi:hypothetical protein
VSLRRLPKAYFAYKCPRCGTPRVRTGQWFYAIAGYTCDGCGAGVRVTYDEKVKLLSGQGVKADGSKRDLPSGSN